MEKVASTPQGQIYMSLQNYKKSYRKNNKFGLLFLLFGFLIYSCSNTNNKRDFGYLFQIAGDYCFIPIKEIDSTSTLSSFVTENFETGISFYSYDSKWYPKFTTYLDTIKFDGFGSYNDKNIGFLKMCLVEIKRKRKAPDEVMIKDPYSIINYQGLINGRKFTFNLQGGLDEIYWIRPIKVKNRYKLTTNDLLKYKYLDSIDKSRFMRK